jgi:hypothetical protein
MDTDRYELDGVRTRGAIKKEVAELKLSIYQISVEIEKVSEQAERWLIYWRIFAISLLIISNIILLVLILCCLLMILVMARLPI